MCAEEDMKMTTKELLEAYLEQERVTLLEELLEVIR